MDRRADADHRRDRTDYHGGDALHRVVRPDEQPEQILEVDRPRLVRTRFGSWLLRGVEQAHVRGPGRRYGLTQEFWTNGIISVVMARIFAFGSYKGGFRGELNSFVRLAEREARSNP